MGLPAGGAPIVKDDGASDVLCQYPFELPHQLLAFLQVALDRLLLDQPFYLRIAVTAIIQLGTAPVAQVEVLVWVGPAARLVGGDDVVLAHTLGAPVGVVARFPRALQGARARRGRPGERGLEPVSEGTVMRAGDTLRFATPGGGGWGHPFDRPPALVERDVRNGF